MRLYSITSSTASMKKSIKKKWKSHHLSWGYHQSLQKDSSSSVFSFGQSYIQGTWSSFVRGPIDYKTIKTPWNGWQKDSIQNRQSKLSKKDFSKSLDFQSLVLLLEKWSTSSLIDLVKFSVSATSTIFNLLVAFVCILSRVLSFFYHRKIIEAHEFLLSVSECNWLITNIFLKKY